MAEDTIGAILEAAASIQEKVDGVKKVYIYSPEAMVDFPCIINYPLRGRDIREEASTMRSLYTFGFELHAARGVIEESQKIVRPMANRIADAFWRDPTMGGTVSTILEVRHAYMPIRYAAEWHICIRFEVDVKVRRRVAI